MLDNINKLMGGGGIRFQAMAWGAAAVVAGGYYYSQNVMGNGSQFTQEELRKQNQKVQPNLLTPPKRPKS